jgi:hypothetical protein
LSCLPEPDPVAALRRRTARRTLIPEEAACALCGFADDDGYALEDDHVLGLAGSDTARVWLCKNCHAVQTAARHHHQAGTPAGRQRPDLSLLERLARALRSLGVFAHELSLALFTFAHDLIAFSRGLDEFAPGWRSQGWAQ